MTSNWFENVKRREGSVEAYIAGRHAAYLDRWSEAGRFITSGATVLDIGGGNLFPALLEYLTSRGINYHYRDVDPGAVQTSRILGERFGMPADRFRRGFNDELDVESASMDFIFSSHCIEHSIDLRATFLELNRVLKQGGTLLMAVPLGWETNPEHPYFLDPQLWVALLEDSGFDVRVAQIGKEYPETGHDLFVAARKVTHCAATYRIDPSDYKKDSYSFMRFDHRSIVYEGDKRMANGLEALHLRGGDWKISITAPAGAKELCPILLRHDWSAKVAISAGNTPTYEDLYSWFPYAQPVRHWVAESAQTIEIRPIGRNAASRSTEAVFFGFLAR